VPAVPPGNIRLDASIAPEEELNHMRRLPYPVTDLTERFTVPPPLPDRLLLLRRELHTHLHHSSCPSKWCIDRLRSLSFNETNSSFLCGITARA
jgi:hypothetical protein